MKFACACDAVRRCDAFFVLADGLLIWLTSRGSERETREVANLGGATGRPLRWCALSYSALLDVRHGGVRQGAPLSPPKL